MKKKIKVEEEYILCDVCGTHLTTKRLPYTIPKTEMFKNNESSLDYFDLCFQHLIDYNNSSLTLKEYISKKGKNNMDPRI